MNPGNEPKASGGYKKSSRERKAEGDNSSVAATEEIQWKPEYVQHYITALNDRHEERELELQKEIADQRLEMQKQLADMQKDREEAAKAQLAT